MFPFNLISLIPGLFNTVNGITNAIANERIAVVNAKTDQERIAAQERVNSLQAQRDVLVEDAKHSKLDTIMRFLIAVGPAAFLTKIFLWDKVIGSFASDNVWKTDPLDVNLWGVITAVIGFYFLYSGAIGVTKIIKS